MGPYWSIRDNVGPYRTLGAIWDYKGPYGTMKDHMGPYRTIWGYPGDYPEYPGNYPTYSRFHPD